LQKIKNEEHRSTIFKIVEKKNLLLELVFTRDEFQLKLVSFLKKKIYILLSKKFVILVSTYLAILERKKKIK
jgi:hypothetical protein